MEITGATATRLSFALAKLLYGKFLQEPEAVLADDLAGIGREKIEGTLERRKAARQFEEMADAIVARITASLEEFARRDQTLAIDTIANEVAATLETAIARHFFVPGDWDPVLLTADYRDRRPLPTNALPADETTVYELVLDEICRYIVETASLLPRFEDAFEVESLNRLSHLHDDIRQVLDTVQQIEKQVTLAGADRMPRYEADYRQAVIRNLDQVELFGATIPAEAQRNRLTEAFVSLNIQQHTAEHATMLPCAAAFDTLTPEAGRILIRGSAGSGKTTLLRWTSIQAARGVRKRPAHGIMEVLRRLVGTSGAGKRIWQSRIPFLIPLRHCQGGQLPPPQDIPSLIAAELGQPPANWVQELLETGRALVLIDGIDEVPNANRAAA